MKCQFALFRDLNLISALKALKRNELVFIWRFLIDGEGLDGRFRGNCLWKFYRKWRNWSQFEPKIGNFGTFFRYLSGFRGFFEDGWLLWGRGRFFRGVFWAVLHGRDFAALWWRFECFAAGLCIGGLCRRKNILWIMSLLCLEWEDLDGLEGTGSNRFGRIRCRSILRWLLLRFLLWGRLGRRRSRGIVAGNRVFRRFGRSRGTGLCRGRGRKGRCRGVGLVLGALGRGLCRGNRLAWLGTRGWGFVWGGWNGWLWNLGLSWLIGRLRLGGLCLWIGLGGLVALAWNNAVLFFLILFGMLVCSFFVFVCLYRFYIYIFFFFG